jgi:hypothetical protein
MNRTLVALATIVTSSLLSHAWAATECARDVDSLEQEGFGTIYANAGYELEASESRFYEACFERDGWVVRAPLLIVRTDANERVSLQATEATLETTGATGTLRDLGGPTDDLRFGGVRLELQPSFKLEGFPSARYTASAARGAFTEDVLTLEGAVLDRLNPGGEVVERYAAAAARLGQGRGVLADVRLVQANVAIGAESGSSGNGGTGFSVSNVTGRIGRNAAGSEVTFTAASAVRLEDGVLFFEGATLYFLGIPLPLGGVRYDPNCPLELPLVVNPFGGLTLGFDGIRFSCGGNGRATIIGYNILSDTPKYVAFITASDGPLSLFVGQRLNETFRAQLSNQPDTGFLAAFSVDTGLNLEGRLDTERYLETRFGLARAFTFSVARVRPTIEVGAVAQSIPNDAATDATLLFSSVGLSGAATLNAGPVTFSVSAASSYTFYSDGSSAANSTLAFGARFALDGFSVGAGARYSQQWIQAVIRRQNISDYTYLDADVRYAPNTGAPTLGFVGLRLEKPVVGFAIVYDPRNARFVNQRFELGLTFALYDGVLLADNFGRTFQTPSFAVAPRGVYDLVTGEGSVGAVFSLYGQGLVYDLGLGLTLPTSGLSFSFGVRLR